VRREPKVASMPNTGFSREKEIGSSENFFKDELKYDTEMTQPR
jgi:hypothetical protein